MGAVDHVAQLAGVYEEGLAAAVSVLANCSGGSARE